MTARASQLILGGPRMFLGSEAHASRLIVKSRREACDKVNACRASGVQLIGILAFLHSLLFVALWLWVCASAGAAGNPKLDFSSSLKQSQYKPVQSRDPFSRYSGPVIPVQTKSSPAPPIVLHLDGILYETSSPSAIVNGTLLKLDKETTVNSEGNPILVKAVEVTRTRVVVEVNGQRIELVIGSQTPSSR